MTEEKEITCIVCPIGCKILVETDGKHIKNLDGNKCKHGIDYAEHEALDPRRMLTTSVFVDGGEWPLVSVKSAKSVPKEKIFNVVKCFYFLILTTSLKRLTPYLQLRR